ncbi:hypothetical protein T09_2059 [Trichinella sp. T9]|nr:hypothetical protein T09_2059 [Trichinella sp. T9]
MQILLLDEPRWTGWWMSCVGEPMASGIDSPLHSVVRPYPILDAKNKSAQLTVMHGDVVQCIEQQLRSHGKMRTETSHASEQLVAYVFPLNIHLLQ